MFESPKKVPRNHLRDVPKPGKYCDVEGCGRRTVVYIKEHDICRCEVCFQNDIDNAGASSNQKVVERIKNAKSP